MADLELTLGAPAAGGGCVARDDAGRVVFVRHGLPGERVRAVITEERTAWARADAVEILEPSPDRVDPPCPYAGHDKCGGCDYQHVSLGAQRALKAALVASQLLRVAGIEIPIEVRAAPGTTSGLATRTRVRYAVSDDGHLAMRRHRSHELVDVDGCMLAVDRIGALDLAARRWPARGELEAIALGGSDAPTLVVAGAAGGDRGTRAGRDPEPVVDPATAPVQHTVVAAARYVVSPGVFWQVHTRAPELLVDAVMAGLALSPGDAVLDLYCGAGLFSVPIATAVGHTGSVHCIDASVRATADARDNLAAHPWARVQTARVDARSVRRAAARCSHVVMDPPRRGVDAGALAAVCASTAVRRVVSVSCDPSTFARDLRRMLDSGFELDSIEAHDLFEMTEHVECVAVLAR